MRWAGRSLEQRLGRFTDGRVIPVGTKRICRSGNDPAILSTIKEDKRATGHLRFVETETILLDSILGTEEMLFFFKVRGV
jgi:hypothetical protein